MMNKLAATLLSSCLAFSAGCATETDGALHLTGRLADPSRVTHVIATNPATGERVVVDMKADGLADGVFDIALPGKASWIITFADADKTGEAMRVATLQTTGIDAFSSRSGGTIDFGTVHFSGTTAHGQVDWDELVDAMGFDQETLVKMGKLDDLALRYTNPDVDADGTMDALQGRLFRLELEGQFTLQRDGRDLTITDLVTGGGELSLEYTGTAIHAIVPSSMGMNMTSGTVRFQEAFFGTAYGRDTEAVKAGTPVGYPHIKHGELDGNPHIGVVASPEHAAPSGAYQFGFDNGVLTFSDVRPPSTAGLGAAIDYSVPFVRIRPSAQGCVTNCEISSVDIAWKRAQSYGWEAAPAPRDARITVLARVGGENKYLAADLVDGATSIEWQSMPVTNTGILWQELSYISTANVCYVAVSYTSELGMKMTNQVTNPACF